MISYLRCRRSTCGTPLLWIASALLQTRVLGTPWGCETLPLPVSPPGVRIVVCLSRNVDWWRGQTYYMDYDPVSVLSPTLIKQDTHKNMLIKTVMYNATCTNSHRDIEECLAPFPLVAYSHPMSGSNDRSSRLSYSHHCGLRSLKLDCSHRQSSSGVSPDSVHSLGLFRYGGRENF